MKGVLVRLKDNGLLRNSAIFSMGGLIASAGAYLFHFLMARMLSVSEYGELQSLLSLSAIISIPSIALTTVIVKYTATFRAKESHEKIFSLFTVFTKKLLALSLALFALFFFLRGPISNFLKIESHIPVIMLGGSFAFLFLFSVNSGVLQGFQKFAVFSLINIATVAFKVAMAVALVLLSFRVGGVVAAVVLSAAFSYLISLGPLRPIFRNKEKGALDMKNILKYFFPVFVSLFFTSLFLNADVVLVKHFFSPDIAGQYGALATVGRVIFFISGPVASVMFPMAAHAYANGNSHFSILKNSFCLVGLVGLAGTVAYFLFPGLAIRILVGDKFLLAVPYLGWFGLAMLLYSLVFLLASYLLSVNYWKQVWILGFGAALQFVLISFWHDSLWQVVWIMNGVMAITLFGLIIFACKKLNFAKVQSI